MITVTGPLMRDAEMRLSTNCTAVVQFLIDCTGGMPIEARLVVGSTAQHALDAQAIASRWKRGAHVEVRGEALRTRSDHDIAAVVLYGNVGVRAL
jgi:hypothetical protein